MNATCYHLRNLDDRKIVGGSLGMSRRITLAEGALVVAGMLDVAVSSSGRVVFTRDGKEVRAYLSLDAGDTDKGREALREWRARREAEERERAARDDIESMNPDAIAIAELIEAATALQANIPGSWGDATRAALAKIKGA